MPITLKYGAPGALMGAGYAAGQNQYRRDQQRLATSVQMEQDRLRTMAYLHGLDVQQRQQALDQEMVWPEPADESRLMPGDRVQLKSQRAANDRARRQGKPLPFPGVEPGGPVQLKRVLLKQKELGDNARVQFKEQNINQRNQAGIDAANKRAANVQEGEDRRAKMKADAEVIPPAPDFDAPGELGPRGGGANIPGKPLADPSRDKTSMLDNPGYFGQPLAATGLVGSSLPPAPDFMGQYQSVLANLNQQFSQQQQAADVEQSPYLQWNPEQNQSPYYG